MCGSAFSATIMYCPFDGEDGGTPNADYKGGHTGTWAGNAQIDTSDKVFGSGSLLLDGTGDYITFPDSTDWNFMNSSTSTYTISCWYKSTYQNRAGLWGQYIDDDNKNYFVLIGENNPDNNTTGIKTGGTWAMRASIQQNTTDGNWHHFALISVGGDVQVYIDGDAATNGENDYFASASDLASVWYVGAGGTGALYPGNGSMDDFFITDDNHFGADPTSSTDTFTVPTAPFAETQADHEIPDSCVLLLHNQGADTSTTIVDSYGGHSPTTTGDGEIDTAQSYFGGASFNNPTGDGGGDGISVTANADFDFGSGAFTLAGWFRIDSGTGGCIFENGYYESGVNDNYMIRFRTTAIDMYAYDGQTNAQSEQTLMTNNVDQWYHVALVRETGSSNIKIYRDGALMDTWTDITNDVGNSDRAFEVGNDATGNNAMIGHYDEVIVAKGAALFTENFTPPIYTYAVASATASVGDSVLWNAWDGADEATNSDDQSQSAHTETFVANAQLDTAQKKFGTASLLLDGTLDSVTYPNSSDFDGFSATNNIYTWSTWVYITDISALSNTAWLYNFKHNGEDSYYKAGINTSSATDFRLRDGGATTIGTSGSGTIQEAKWVHYCAIVDGTGAFGLYIDGVQVAYDNSWSGQSMNGLLSIGRDQGPTYYHEGWIDDMFFSDTNYYNASPNAGITNTIYVPTTAYNEEEAAAGTSGKVI